MALMLVGPNFGGWLAAKVGLGPLFVTMRGYMRWSIAIAFAVLAIEFILRIPVGQQRSGRDQQTRSSSALGLPFCGHGFQIQPGGARQPHFFIVRTVEVGPIANAQNRPSPQRLASLPSRKCKASRKKNWVPTRFHVGPLMGLSFWPVLKNMLLSIPKRSRAFPVVL
jgi:hypothetical protein